MAMKKSIVTQVASEKPGRKSKSGSHVVGDDWATVVVKMPKMDVALLEQDAMKANCNVATVIRRIVYAQKKWTALKKVSDS